MDGYVRGKGKCDRKQIRNENLYLCCDEISHHNKSNMSEKHYEHTFPSVISTQQQILIQRGSDLVCVYDNELNKFLELSPSELSSLGEKMYDAGRNVSCYGGRYFYIEPGTPTGIKIVSFEEAISAK